MATATRNKTTFNLSCPHCQSADETVTLNLNDLDECRCVACDETFSPKEAYEMFAAHAERWAKVMRMVAAAAGILSE